ncbi:MAG: hypothetical protein J7647_07310 [Cyanobacteria bacterium SBLK]|nr:hypothetical protein [Cyanobacteria bacterium SBLK]
MTNFEPNKPEEEKENRETAKDNLSEDLNPPSSEDEDNTTSESSITKLPQILEKILPEEVKRKIPNSTKKEMEVFLSMQRMGMGSPLGNLTEKIQPSHITQFLENDAKQDERAFLESKESKKYTLYYVLIFCVLFVFVTVYLVQNDIKIYQDLIRLVIVFLGGFGSGIGYKTLRDKRNK